LLAHIRIQSQKSPRPVRSSSPSRCGLALHRGGHLPCGSTFLSASAFMDSLERNASPKRLVAPRLVARRSMSAMSSVPKRTAPRLGARRAKFMNANYCRIQSAKAGPGLLLHVAASSVFDNSIVPLGHVTETSFSPGLHSRSHLALVSHLSRLSARMPPAGPGGPAGPAGPGVPCSPLAP
jgi:hypothetical protein